MDLRLEIPSCGEYFSFKQLKRFIIFDDLFLSFLFIQRILTPCCESQVFGMLSSERGTSCPSGEEFRLVNYLKAVGCAGQLKMHACICSTVRISEHSLGTPAFPSPQFQGILFTSSFQCSSHKVLRHFQIKAMRNPCTIHSFFVAVT